MVGWSVAHHIPFLATPLFPPRMAIRGSGQPPLKSLPSDWQGAGVLHRATSLFSERNIFLSHRKHSSGILAACLPSPLCPQWPNAHVSGMEAACRHESISALPLAGNSIRISLYCTGRGKRPDWVRSRQRMHDLAAPPSRACGHSNAWNSSLILEKMIKEKKRKKNTLRQKSYCALQLEWWMWCRGASTQNAATQKLITLMM